MQEQHAPSCPIDLSMPKVSIIIPCYNHALFVGEAIESVLEQSYDDFEIVVVDDGSTDKTREVVASYKDQVRYIWQENQGLAAARNTAIRNAHADVIALLDSDDLWKPEYLAKMIDLLNQNPRAGAVYCGFQYIDAEGQEVGVPSLKVVTAEMFHKVLVCEGNWLAPCSVVFRKHLAEKVGLFDESISPVADADLWTRLSAIRPFVGLPEVLVKYRRHASNMSKDPNQMVTASYLRHIKMFGRPDGNISSWPELKRCAYAKLFLSGATNYLAYGDAEKSAHFLKQLFKVSPSLVLSIGCWRRLIRAHLPDEERNDPSSHPDWSLAQRDILNIQIALATRNNAQDSLQRNHSEIKGWAFMAMAEEAGRANNLPMAVGWLLRVVATYPPLLFSRPYWGAVIRSVTNKGVVIGP